jgi:pimeloyl-ACP methyl ester carboxylesterase
MPKVLARGINIHYLTRGEGPDIVLLHGVTSSLAAWYNGILSALEAAGFRVTIYDLRGHGLSDSTPSGYTSSEMAADLLALMDALGLEKPMLGGHSFGGAVALHFALLHPDRVRGVILLDSSIPCLRRLRMIEDWQGWQTHSDDLARGGFTLEWFLEQVKKDDMTDFLRKALSVNVRGFKKRDAGLSARLRKLLDETHVATEFREVDGLTEELLKTVATPVLGLFGAASPNKKMAAHLASIMPNCCQEVLEGVGHLGPIHEPKVVVAQMVPFSKDPIGFIQRAKSVEIAAEPG